ncbi:MAG TPA: MarR family transcriptional regulator [Candidatus Saccharimonadales bacterium]|nr:MarR family transcriptional regulator [Candidatus Saccharimonadales bacterium]
MSTIFIMNREDLEKQLLMAAQNQGISSVLFRNASGRKLGVNATDNECLSFLAIKRQATPSELARYTGLSTGSTTAMLDRLAKAGFIIRKPNPNDKRGALIEVSKKWAEATKPLVFDLQTAHKELLSDYTNEQLQAIISFLTRFTNNVEQQTARLEDAS